MKPKQRLFRLRTPASHQVDEEIALHIELRTRELMARGMAADAARAEAEQRLGTVDNARLLLQRAAVRRDRRVTIREWLAGWAQDFRYSARALQCERMLALVIVLTLALGLGANTVMFGIVDHLLLRGPAHVVDAEQVRRVYITHEQRGRGLITSAATGYVAYTTLRANTTSFDAVAAYTIGKERLGRGATAREIPVGLSTAGMFDLLAVQPVLGRFYTPEEDRPWQAERVAVIDWGFWQSEYGGSADALGRTLTVGDIEYSIIGVAPTGFTGPELRPVSVWLPVSAGWPVDPGWPTTWSMRWLYVIARMAPGIAPDVAAAEATTAFRAAAEGQHATLAQATLSLRPLRYGASGEEPAEASVARWLLGVSAVVLLIAAANVMNLLLARVLRRRREVAIRLAVGISRGRLARLLLSESLLLAAAGLASALMLANWGGQFVRAALLPDVQWGAPLGGRTLLFALAAALLTGVVVGLAPALQSGRQQVSSLLRAAGPDGGARSGRATLTVAQSAFSLVLLVGAGLFVRSLWNVSRLDLGIDADRVLAAWPVYASADDDGMPAGGGLPGFEQPTAREQLFLDDAVERLNARPDVERATLARGTPLQVDLGIDVWLPDGEQVTALPGGGPYITAPAPGYFETVGTRILRGRGFEPGEGAASDAVVVVNETMARTLWPGEDALTKCVVIGVPDAPCTRVVGMAQDAHRSGIREEPVMQYYVPLGQDDGLGGTHILVRPRGDATAFEPVLRGMLDGLDPGIAYFRIDALQRALDPEMRPWRLGATMFLIFGSLALLIAGIGLYSVIAYSVAQRRTEIGVRKALGAHTSVIVAMIVRQAIGFVMVGVAVGAAIALFAAPRLEPLLFETVGRDAVAFAAAAAVLAAAALLASIVPAIRAARTDPVEALKGT